jgi:hypothetical protein
MLDQNSLLGDRDLLPVGGRHRSRLEVQVMQLLVLHRLVGRLLIGYCLDRLRGRV